MSEQEKKRQRIYDLLNAERNQAKKLPKQLEFLHDFHQPKTLTPFVMLNGVFWKTKQIQLPNIGLLKTAIKEEWNKMSEELILKTCKLFRRRIDTIITKMVAYLLILLFIGLAVRVFANGPGDLGLIPGRVIPKTQKMVLDASLLNTQHYKVPIKGKVEPSREGVATYPTSWCSSYRKGSLRVTLDYGRQLYLLIF